MRRYLSPFIIILTTFVALTYFYAANRLTSHWLIQLALVLPFILVWLIPVIYWMERRESKNQFDNILHVASYVSMGWLSFLFLFLIMRDILLLLAIGVGANDAQQFLSSFGSPAVFVLSLLALFLGLMRAKRGPNIQQVEIEIPNLPQELHGFCIAQISDLHVGPTIRKGYVNRVVELTNQVKPDIIALTGDIVDGSVDELAPVLASLAKLMPADRVYLALGNHDYYSGSEAWTQHFTSLGMRVLLNSHVILAFKSVNILIGGVLDPAARMVSRELKPDPFQAMINQVSGPTAPPPALRLLLAHNPQIAPDAERAGFDLQLSGHTHAGQFFPWNLVTRLVHAPHFAGLSRQGAMQVYVSAGTGSWGPPIRFGTKLELTVIRLKPKTRSL